MLRLTLGGAFPCLLAALVGWTRQAGFLILFNCREGMGSDPVSGAFQHTSRGNDLRRLVFAPPDGQMKTRRSHGRLPGFDQRTRTNVFYHVMLTATE